MAQTSTSSKATVALIFVSIVLLIVGLAPSGLMQIARSLGFDTSEPSAPLMAIIGGFILLGGLILIGRYRGVRTAFIIVLVLAILNLAGCSIMWSDFSRI